MERLVTVVLAIIIAFAIIKLMPIRSNFTYETALNPVQGADVAELDALTKAMIAVGTVQDTRVKTARPSNVPGVAVGAYTVGTAPVEGEIGEGVREASDTKADIELAVPEAAMATAEGPRGMMAAQAIQSGTVAPPPPVAYTPPPVQTSPSVAGQ